MKPIKDLEIGFGDAENYLQRKNRDFFNFVFIHNRYLDKILEPNRYFLVGEKGTGKTAYSAFLSNNRDFKGYVSCLKFIRETEYAKFVNMKRRNSLDLSDYADVWMVILMLLFAGLLSPKDIDDNIVSRSIRFNAIKKACEDFYKTAFSPEIAQAIRFVEESKSTARLVNKWMSASAEISESERQIRDASLFQTNLLYLKRTFIEALSRLRLKGNHLLFIDGIDVRPGDIPFKDYLECVKGLANAVWQLNTDIFPNFRDTPGRFRVILLVRPDIFNSLGLQNSTNKIHDNSVFLDWNTTYADYQTSDLYRLSNKMLQWKQTEGIDSSMDIWDMYFPWTISDAPQMRFMKDNSFIYFLRYSYCRPRDIVSAVGLLKESAFSMGMGDSCIFSKELVDSAYFKNQYSEFLLSGIKDQLSFYYTEDDYQVFRNFFMWLKGRCDFDYQYFSAAFDSFMVSLKRKNLCVPNFLNSSEAFLQFLYDMNVLAYKERTDKGSFVRWCYRERCISNLSPRVELDGQYTIHYGLRKALNLGYASRIEEKC